MSATLGDPYMLFQTSDPPNVISFKIRKLYKITNIIFFFILRSLTWKNICQNNVCWGETRTVIPCKIVQSSSDRFFSACSKDKGWGDNISAQVKAPLFQLINTEPWLNSIDNQIRGSVSISSHLSHPQSWPSCFFYHLSSLDGHFIHNLSPSPTIFSPHYSAYKHNHAP